MKALDDKQMKEALKRGQFPKRYCPINGDAVGLHNLGSMGKEVLDWFVDENPLKIMRKEGVVEFVADDDQVIVDCAYTLAKGLMGNKVGCGCLYAHDIIHNEDIHEWLSDGSYQCILLYGLCSSHQGQFTQGEYGILEWFITRWLARGKSVILLHECAIDTGEGFTRLFKGKVKSVLAKQFRRA